MKNVGGGRRQVILNTGAGVGNQFGAKTVRERGRMGLGGNHSGPIEGSRNVRGGRLHDSHDAHFGGRADRRGGRIGQRGGHRRNLKGEKGNAATADDLNDELDKFFQRVRWWDGRFMGAHPSLLLWITSCFCLWLPHPGFVPLSSFQRFEWRVILSQHSFVFHPCFRCDQEPTSKKTSLDSELDAYFDKTGADEAAGADDEADVGEEATA